MGRKVTVRRDDMSSSIDKDKVMQSQVMQKQNVGANVLDEWSDFLRKYQHDLQGPLRNIANFLQILKDELSKPEAIDKSATLKCISAAEHCVYTLNSININQLIDNNNVIETFDLEELLEPLFCLLLSQLNERRCRIDIDPDIPHITGNKDEILRVFKNLLENSLNHAKTKQPLVVKISKLCQRGNRVMLQFSDNGKKLTDVDRNKIRNSLSSQASGVSIVNSLLKKNNGYFQFVKSDIGCLWELELPAVASQSNPMEKNADGELLSKVGLVRKKKQISKVFI